MNITNIKASRENKLACTRWIIGGNKSTAAHDEYVNFLWFQLHLWQERNIIYLRSLSFLKAENILCDLPIR